MRPDISVVIPAHNEGAAAGRHDRLDRVDARTTSARVEIVIADDKSDDDAEAHLRAAWPEPVPA